MSHRCSTGSTRGIHSDFFRRQTGSLPRFKSWTEHRTIGAIPRRKICQEDVCHWKNHLFQCASSKFFKYQSVSQRDVSWFRRKGLCITVHVHIIYIISIHFTSTFLSCVVICSILPNHIWLYHTPVFAGQTGSQCHPGSVHVRSGCWGLDHGR